MKNKIINKHNKIKFEEENHIYKIKETTLQSVTSFISQFHKKFEKNKILNQISKGDKLLKIKLKYDWDNSSTWGTYIHELLEEYVNIREDGKELKDYKKRVKEFQVLQGIELIDYYLNNGWEVLSPEVRVYSEELGLCGTCDLILINQQDELLILDYKTCTSIPTYNFNKEFFYTPINHLDDTKHNHYAIQLSVYRYLLELDGHKVIGHHLIHLPKNAKGNIIKLDYLKKEVKKLIETKKDIFINN
jgi:ATP-dependent exoDNAse (exonuclease V) beta subunit